MRTPVLAITGVHAVAVDATAMNLLWELPDAVALAHRIDPIAQTLTRTVSDASGILEREVIDLEHACIYCALRKDILPTLERLADIGRWGTIVASLPISAEAEQLSQALTQQAPLVRKLRLAAVITAVEPVNLEAVLLGSDLLVQRHLHTGPTDDRGLGETACALVEFADAVVVTSALDPGDDELIRALMRPDADLITGAENVDGHHLARLRHKHAEAVDWRQPFTQRLLPPFPKSRAWRLELRSDAPVHPERLLDQIEPLGAGPYRTRGCLWVPTRADTCISWEGAGGHLTIGSRGGWSSHAPHTKLVYTGVGVPPPQLRRVFNEVLLSPVERCLDARHWDTSEDGLEPWLGLIHKAA